MAANKTVADLKGYVVALSLTGSVTPQFSRCFMEMRSYMELNGMRNIEYDPGKYGLHVEAARDDVAAHALKQNYDWILQVDADATFPPDTLHRLLEHAFIHHPDAGVVGAYCQLKPEPHVPTIDTGTGTWEEHYPGEGVIPVIRTGAHCFLTKTWVFKKIGPAPWFRTRIAQRPIQAFREVDNFARCRLSGVNPLTDSPEWATLMEMARVASVAPESMVGEDSAFFDRCRAHNVSVLIDTDLMTGHVANHVIQPGMFRDKVRESRRLQRLALGVG